MTVYAGLWGPAPFIDTLGNAVPAAEVTVYAADGVTPATLYANWDRSVALANPLPVGQSTGNPGLDPDANGLFWADPGRYVLSVKVAGLIVFHGPIVVNVDPSEQTDTDAAAIAALTAADIDFDPIGVITATNAQDAIGQIALGSMFVYKTLATTRSSANTGITLTDDPELFVPLEANSFYIVDLTLFYDGDTQASGLGDLKVAITVPGLTSIKRSAIAMSTSASIVTTTVDLEVVTTSGTAINAGTLGAGTMIMYRSRAIVRTGANAGNLVIQHAQRVLSAIPTTVFEDSFLLVAKVA